MMGAPGMSAQDEAEFRALRALSASIGADPLQVQAAGGNTSLKAGGRMWIKASGTWLSRALDDDIMVPVMLGPLLDAVAQGRAEADTPHLFVDDDLNPSGLRPSVETSVHAVLPHKVVVHVHCVDTIAVAVRKDAGAILGERLKGMNPLLVPYVKPGLSLARAIAERSTRGTDIVVLGNHGLVVAADSVGEAGTLLARVRGLLAQPARALPAPNRDALLRLAAGSDYRLPGDDAVHAAACDLVSCRIAAGGSLYPDHVVFIGRGSVVAGPHDTAADLAHRAADRGEPAPVSILFPGKGVLMRRDATPSAEAMALCLSHVAARIGADAPLRYLSEAENAELLDWDAEKYRQKLNRLAVPGRQ